MKPFLILPLSVRVFSSFFSLPAWSAEEPGLRMSEPRSGVNTLTPEDIKIENPWPGRLVYAAFRGGTSTLGVCDTGRSSGVEQSRYYQAIPSSQNRGSTLYAPILSPDGRQVLLRYGEGYDFSDYLFAVFNPEGNTTRVLGPRARYNSASWSPDGRCIAYMGGGDAFGNNLVTIPTDPPTVLSVPVSLQVFDLQTGQDQKVIANNTLRGPFTWKDARTPVYAVLSLEAQRIVDEQNKKRDEAVDEAVQQSRKPTSSPVKKTLPPASGHLTKELAPQPNVSAFSLDTGKEQLLFQDGYRPLPSPNGSWMAFFGSENPDKPISLRPEWTAIPTGAALCVAQADGKQRRALSLFADYPQMLWRNDNRHLLTLENHKRHDGRSRFEGTIKEWDSQTGHFRVVNVLQSQDTGAPDYSIIDPKFRFLAMSQDGSSAFVVVSETQGKGTTSLQLTLSTLEAVNLDNGNVTVIARIRGTFGTRIDWREQPNHKYTK